MRKNIEKTFALVAALSCVCAPTLLMIIGIWMIYNVGLWIGLGIGFVGYAASAFEYGYLESFFKSKKSKNKTK